MHFLRYCIPLFFINLCFAQNMAYQAIALDKNLTDNANAIYRIDEMTIDIISKRKMVYKVKKVVTVLNKYGNRYAMPSVYYDNEKKIKNIDVHIYDRLGAKIKHVKRKDFQDISATDGFSLYNDDRLLHYSYTPVQYPYTMEFEYEVETMDTGAFPPWYFLSGYLVSTETSKYSIRYPNEILKPVIKEYNVADKAITRTHDGNTITYTANSIPAMKEEWLSPGFLSIAPRLSIRLSEFHYKGFDAKVDDWNDLGIWIHDKLLKERTALPEQTKAIVRDLVKGQTDDLEKAKIIYKYVQENTRYISVQIGIGGFRPISALDVDRNKYGDCKGLSNYTKALLSVVGVTSYYTVVEAGNRKVDFEEDFADLYQGNHVILAIPYEEKYYWVDCTSQIHPFGFVGDFTDNRKVLVVKPDGGEIVQTVSYLNKDNYQNTTGQYTLLTDGSINGSVSITTKGTQYDDHFILQEKTHEEVVTYYKKYLNNINNLKVDDYSFDNNVDNVVFKEDLKVSARNYASKAGNRLLFAPNTFNRMDHVPKRYRNRKQPFEIQRGFFDEDTFTITLPEDYSIEAIPEGESITTEFGEYAYTLSYDASLNRLSYKRSIYIKEGFYPKEKYSDYRDFRKKTASLDNAQIVLVKK